MKKIYVKNDDKEWHCVFTVFQYFKKKTRRSDLFIFSAWVWRNSDFKLCIEERDKTEFFCVA